MAKKAVSEDPVVAELIAIKKLFIAALLRWGMNQNEVAKAMGTTQATVSRMFPKGAPKALSGSGK